MTKTIRAVMLAVLSIAMSVGLYICIMVYGWGMEPKSWWWIIVGQFGGQLIVQFLISAAKDDLNG